MNSTVDELCYFVHSKPAATASTSRLTQLPQSQSPQPQSPQPQPPVNHNRNALLLNRQQHQQQQQQRQLLSAFLAPAMNNPSQTGFPSSLAYDLQVQSINSQSGLLPHTHYNHQQQHHQHHHHHLDLDHDHRVPPHHHMNLQQPSSYQESDLDWMQLMLLEEELRSLQAANAISLKQRWNGDEFDFNNSFTSSASHLPTPDPSEQIESSFMSMGDAATTEACMRTHNDLLALLHQQSTARTTNSAISDTTASDRWSSAEPSALVDPQETPFSALVNFQETPFYALPEDELAHGFVVPGAYVGHLRSSGDNSCPLAESVSVAGVNPRFIYTPTLVAPSMGNPLRVQSASTANRRKSPPALIKSMPAMATTVVEAAHSFGKNNYNHRITSVAVAPASDSRWIENQARTVSYHGMNDDVWKHIMVQATMAAKHAMPPSNISRMAIEKYFEQHEQDSALVFYTPKVGQKSYGTEKRFFCPPPMVRIVDPMVSRQIQVTGDDQSVQFPWTVRMSLDGTGWISSDDCGGRVSCSRVVRDGSAVMGVFRNVFSGDLKGMAAKLRKAYDVHCASGLIAKAGVPDVQAMFENAAFADFDKKKTFEFNLRLCSRQDADQFDHQSHVGLFPSKPVTLISKPVKKKATTARMERGNKGVEVICSGNAISLYNRLRSQTVATKFLGLPDEVDSTANFVGKANDWDAFVIERVETNANGSPLGGYAVHSGNQVVLRSTKFDWVSPKLVIWLVDQKGYLSKDAEALETVTQLQKVVLELQELPGHFVNIDQSTLEINLYNSVTNEVVPLPGCDRNHHCLQTKRRSPSAECFGTKKQRTSANASEPRSFGLMLESSVWTAVGVDCREFRWFDPRQELHHVAPTGLQSPMEPFCLRDLPVTPTPVVEAVELQDGFLKLQISLPVLPLLDALSVVDSVGAFDELSTVIEFDVFFGNVPCATVSSRNNLLELKALLGTVDSLRCEIRQVCAIPESADNALNIDCGALSIPTPQPVGSKEAEFPFEAQQQKQRDNVKIIEEPIILVRRMDGVVYRTSSCIRYAADV